MNICYFCCSNTYGGVEKIVVDTLNEISNFNDCCLVAPYGFTFKDKLSSKVKIYEYTSSNKRLNPFLYLEILAIIKHYHIVHTHGAKATQITYLLNKFSSFVHIATKHNIRKGKIFNKLKNVISVSNEVAKTITHPSKIIYFGLPLRILEKEKQDIFTIVAIGRLDPIKGFDRLIEEVSKLEFDFRLNIVGEGKQKKALENLIIAKNLQKKVFLLGFTDDIVAQLVKSDLQVISSSSEGLPIVLIEGVLYGSVIISTPVGGIVEIIDKNFLTNIDNFSKKINDIYLNYDKALQDFRLKHNPIKEKFNLNNYITELMSYYKRCEDGKTL